jgi:hypothetical protein
MPRVEFDVETSASPERVRAALIDFTERRPQTWPGITSSLYEVYDVGESFADVKEGTKSPGMTVWAKEHYDWSEPDRVVWTVQESNFCAPGSHVSATVSPKADGGSVIHVEWERTPTSLAGRVAAFVIKASRGKPVAASMRRGLAVIEKQPTA